MAETKIEWADYTFNPWVGCTKLSPACDSCYAESWAKRTGQAHLWQGERRRTSEANWRLPRKWDRDAARGGVRRRVFCASLADVFDNQVPEAWRGDLWVVIRETPALDWLLLTKRPQNIAKMLPVDSVIGWDNVWLGTTVENQEEADRRIPHLLSAPARVRFLSCEPLLGSVDLRLTPHECARCHGGGSVDTHDPIRYPGGAQCPDCRGSGWTRRRIGWVIAGGESGPKARPMHPDWARSLRDQCAEAGVAFHFKQWGEWGPSASGGFDRRGLAARREERGPDGLYRVGKRAAGRVLDGRTHDEFPA